MILNYYVSTQVNFVSWSEPAQVECGARFKTTFFRKQNCKCSLRQVHLTGDFFL